MKFTYDGYKAMLRALRDGGYEFRDYHDYVSTRRCVILRHDVDCDPKAALRLGGVEETLHVSSTYMILLTSDLYNPASARNRAIWRQLLKMGHKIGLHFDEVAYGGELSPEEMVVAIRKEAAALSALLDAPVTSVSMHRPSKATLEADLEIPGIVNSYGKTFFHDFKYLSDSRRYWREPVDEIIQGGKYDRLHILTHVFWYHAREESLSDSVGNFIRGANRERYDHMKENITDIGNIIPREAL